MSILETLWTISIGRCLSDWFGQDAECVVDPGDCTRILDCETGWTAPPKCGEKGRTQADEQALIAADMWVLATRLGAAWQCCLASPADMGCGGCADGTVMPCSEVTMAGSSRFVSEGGCVTTSIDFTVS